MKAGGARDSGEASSSGGRPAASWWGFALFWLRLGCLSFGGPAAHIALMHREAVERLGWLDERRFSHALGFCSLLPGPEAQQLATYIGWRVRGTPGAAIAGTLFVLPSAVLLWFLSLLYVTGGSSPLPAAFLGGVMPVVAALVLRASLRIAARCLRSVAAVLTAAAALLLPSGLHIPYPLILLLALAAGLLVPGWFSAGGGDRGDSGRGLAEAPRSSGRAALIAALLWLVPVALLVIFERGLLARLALFFSGTSLLTFGGAYAILPYVTGHAVSAGWITPPDVLAGLGLAEATPGPLIIVLQFVAFLAAWNQPGTHSPLIAATAASAVATWTTFLPSFVWIYLGAPHVEGILASRRLGASLAAVSACVAGFVAGLAAWVTWQVFATGSGQPGWFNPLLFGLALLLLRFGVLPAILAGGAAGILRHFFLL